MQKVGIFQCKHISNFVIVVELYSIIYVKFIIIAGLVLDMFFSYY